MWLQSRGKWEGREGVEKGRPAEERLLRPRELRRARTGEFPPKSDRVDMMTHEIEARFEKFVPNNEKSDES